MTHHNNKKAVFYRMVTDNHICPFGLKSLALLKRKGFDVEDHKLRTREETDAFKKQHDVKTTPQTFIHGERIGGYDDLRVYFGKSRQQTDNDKTTYQPVIAVFATTLLLALASFWADYGRLEIIPVTELFIAFSMCVLAVLKLRDLFAFSNQFITYDLLGMRYPRYAYVYPFVEMLAGVMMIGGVMTYLAAPAALFIGTVGAISVFKAVYIDKRELKCACVGGNSNVPLGFISLTENLMMVGMAIWMITKMI